MDRSAPNTCDVEALQKCLKANNGDHQKVTQPQGTESDIRGHPLAVMDWTALHGQDISPTTFAC